MKDNFYKTRTEVLLKKAIHKLYNDLIGGNENSMLDGNDYYAYTEESLVDQITNIILSEKSYLEIDDSWEVIEAKHIRFIGKERVKEIVEYYVHKRHEKEKRWLWEK